MNGDLYVLWCEHLSGSHYAPIRMDHGFRESASAVLSAFVPGFNAAHTGALLKDTPARLSSLLNIM